MHGSVCMYRLCIHAYIHAYTYMHMWCIHAYIHATVAHNRQEPLPHLHIRKVYAQIHACIHICMHTNAHVYMHAHVDANIHTYTSNCRLRFKRISPPSVCAYGCGWCSRIRARMIMRVRTLASFRLPHAYAVTKQWEEGTTTGLLGVMKSRHSRELDCSYALWEVAGMADLCLALEWSREHAKAVFCSNGPTNIKHQLRASICWIGLRLSGDQMKWILENRKDADKKAQFACTCSSVDAVLAEGGIIRVIK
jgi:hypothetical protein